jgi:hypothetical protein
VKLTASYGQQWVELLTPPSLTLTIDQIRDQANCLRDMVPNANVDFRTQLMTFESGKDLQDLVRDLKTTLKPEEVAQ